MAMTEIERYQGPQAPGNQLSPRQLAACEALARGASQRAVCREQKISRSTLYEWLQKPGFRTQLAEFRAIVLDEVRTQLIAMLPDAASALRDTITQRPAGPPSHAERTRAVEVAFKAGGVIAGSVGVTAGAPVAAVQIVIGPEVQAIVEKEDAQSEFMWKAHETLRDDPEFRRLYDAWNGNGLRARAELLLGDPHRDVMRELQDQAYGEARRRFGDE